MYQEELEMDARGRLAQSQGKIVALILAPSRLETPSILPPCIFLERARVTPSVVYERFPTERGLLWQPHRLESPGFLLTLHPNTLRLPDVIPTGEIRRLHSNPIMMSERARIAAQRRPCEFNQSQKAFSASADFIAGYGEFFGKFDGPINEHPHPSLVKADQE